MTKFIRTKDGSYLNAALIARIEQDGSGWVAYDRHGDHEWALPEGFDPARDLAEQVIPTARKALSFN